MSEALAFWGVALVVAGLALPLAFRLFARFPDAGAGLSFTLGLTLISTGYFLLRVMGALPAGRGGFILAIALFAVAMVVLAVRDRRFLPTLRRSLRGLTVAAVLFSVLFFGYAFVRAHSPDIAHTEQPMDFLYLNAMLVSPDYPPHDPWFAGENASYYYGGYLQAAVLTGASDVWPATGFNLSLAAVFASAGVAAASLCAALARWLLGARARRWIPVAAAGGVLLLLFSGPLASIFELASAHGASSEGVYTAFGVEGLVRCGADAGDSCIGQPLDSTERWFPTDHWAWWRMSRMSYWGPQPGDTDVITEVPFFSFLLGDLHPHVMAIPGVILALALSAALWRGRGPLSWREHLRRPLWLLVVGLVFGSLAFVNTWDVITLLVVLVAAVLARNLRASTPLPAITDALLYLAAPARLALAAAAVVARSLRASPPVRAIAGALSYLAVPARIAPVAAVVARSLRASPPVRAIAGALSYLAVPARVALAAAVVTWSLRNSPPVPTIAGTFWYLVVPALLALAAYSPWIVDLSSGSVGGLYAYADTGTRIRHVLLFWGTIVVLSLPVIAWAFHRPVATLLLRRLAVAFLFPALPFLLWITLAAAGRTAGIFSEEAGLAEAFSSRGAGGWLTLAFYAAVLWLLAVATIRLAERRHPGAPVAGLVTLGILLLYGTELLFIRDALFFVPRHNTVFKLSYQAWIMLSIASPVVFVAALRFAAPRPRLFLGAPAALLLAGSLVFAVTMMPNRTDGFREAVSLDGLHFVDFYHPDEYALIQWLAENVEPDAVVVEASGRVWRVGDEGQALLEDPGGYGSFGRVGFRAGLQVPVGWPGHERTWRGKEIGPEVDRRRDLVDSVYTAAGREEVVSALRELGATYIVVGREERERYRGGLIPAFETFLDTVFAEGDVRVYRVPTLEEVPTR